MRLQYGITHGRWAVQTGEGEIAEALVKAGEDVSGTSEVRSFSQRRVRCIATCGV
jgi:hypothetical protein